MADITIQNLRVAPSLGPRVPTTLRAYPRSSFLLNDADHSAVTESSPHNAGPHFKSMALTLEGTLYYGAADFTLPSTTDSPDNPDGARWGLAVMDANGRFMYWAAGLESFALDHTDATQDAEDIIAFNEGAPVASTPRDYTVNDLTVLGDADVAGDLDVGGDLTVGDDGDFGGTVTAAAFVGNGAGITGLTGATGGVANTGSTTIGADTDSDGVGVVDLQTRTITRARVRNAGEFELFSPLILPGYAYGSLPTGVTGALARLTDRDRGLAAYTAGAWLSVSGGVYNVKFFQAKGDGVTDDTAAIQAAIDACAADGGGVVAVPTGVYSVTALNMEVDKVRLVGAGRTASILSKSTGTGNTITIGASVQRKENAIIDIGFEPSVNRTSGAEIFAGNFLFLTLDGMQFKGAWDAIILGQAGNQSFNPIVTNILPAAGITNGSKHEFLHLTRVLDGLYSDVSFIGLPDTTGIWLDGGCEGNQFTNISSATGDDVTVPTTGYGLRIGNTIGGTHPRYNKFTNCLFDLWYVNMWVAVGLETHFINVWAGGAKSNTAIIHGVTGEAQTDSATGTSFVGGQAYNNNGSGMRVYGPGSLTLNGFHIIGNNRAANAAGINSSGLVIDQDSGGRMTVTGCEIGNDTQNNTGQQTHYGIWITNRAADSYFSIVGNSLFPCTTLAINNLMGLGGGHIIRDNIGHRTENSGTGTVASGATTVAVTHGLAVTPVAADIQLTPTNFSTNNVRYRVSATSSTTFTVETSGDPGASGFNFSWAAMAQ